MPTRQRVELRWRAKPRHRCRLNRAPFAPRGWTALLPAQAPLARRHDPHRLRAPGARGEAHGPGPAAPLQAGPLPRDPGPVRERTRPRRARRRQSTEAGSSSAGESVPRSPCPSTEQDGSTRARLCPRSLQPLGPGGEPSDPGALRSGGSPAGVRRVSPPPPVVGLGRAPAARLRGRCARVSAAADA